MMQSLFKAAPVAQTVPVSREGQGPLARRWAGGIMVALAIVFLCFDSIIKMSGPGLLPVLGTIELASLVLYVIPRTSVLGAILMTGFLGGTVVSHIRAGSPLLTLGVRLREMMCGGTVAEVIGPI